MRATRTATLALCLGFLFSAGPARAAFVDLTAPEPVALEVGGFELPRDAKVQVEAQGLELSREYRDEGWNWSWGGDSWFDRDRKTDPRLGAYAWIIDAATREAVWVMDSEETDRGTDRDLRFERAELDLPAGIYEVYLYGGHHELRRDIDGNWTRRSLEREMDDVREKLKEVYVRVSSDELGNSVRTFEPTGKFDGALIAFTSVGDSEVRRQAFEITEETELRVYGLMEFPRGNDDPVDFGWIIDMDSGERVWDMSDRRGRRAGGADKNRVLDRSLTLDPGRYTLVYGTDDSHSADEFNSDPPFDPLAWGVQLLPGRDFAPRAFRLLETPTRGEPAIDFSRARDDEFFEQAFRLSRATDVHVYAIGEGVDDGWTWVDYGWIIDATSRETVWEMTDRNTYPAGGSEKNRMFDGSVSLPAGDYIAFYISDDSHSYEEWNDGAPFDPESWGMQIFVENGAFTDIDTKEMKRGAGVLVDITRVREHERERERFTVDGATEVEIYALGEGVRNEMYDYGYIRNLDTRRVVWEMDYRDTDHAGGASKNRMVRAKINLEPGEYEAVYVTDGSHNFGDWNDSRPDDPLSWGMVVRRADD